MDNELCYPPNAETCREMWRMTAPEELERRGIPSVDEYMRRALEEDNEEDSK